MPSPRVLCLGEMLPGPSEPQAAQTEVVAATLGDALAHVACALAKLGTPTALMGRLGDDVTAQDLWGALQGAGVNLEGTQDKGSPTLLPIELFKSAEYLVLGSLALAQPEAAVEKALDLADEYYLKVVVDVNWPASGGAEGAIASENIKENIQENMKEKTLALMQRADFLKLSEVEAKWLLGTADPLDILRQLEHLEGVFVTSERLGAAYAFTQGLVGQQAGFVTAVQDATGAGESFLAGLLHQLVALGMGGLSNASQVEMMMRYASAAAALTTMKAGAIAAQPSHAEIESFLVGRVD